MSSLIIMLILMGVYSTLTYYPQLINWIQVYWKDIT
jgi:hypothetical protein